MSTRSTPVARRERKEKREKEEKKKTKTYLVRASDKKREVISLSFSVFLAVSLSLSSV